MLTLAYRGGVKKIWAHEVCENDDFELSWGIEEKLVHRPCLDNEKGRGAVIGYYAAAILPNDSTTFLYMTKAEVEAHGRRFSRSYGRGPWSTDFDAMAKKTVAKQLFNWLPKSTELAQALARDEAIVRAQPEKNIETSDDVFDMQVENVDAELSPQEEKAE